MASPTQGGAALRAADPGLWYIPYDTEVAFTIPDAPPAPEPEGPIFITGDVQKPVKVYAPQPQYTEVARRARIQGTVIVEAVIDSNGLVTQLKMLKSLPLGLGDEALKTIRTWKFKPATLRGKPVDVYYTVTVTFQLQ